MENNNTNSNKLLNETNSSIYLKLITEYSDIELNIPIENISNLNLFKCFKQTRRYSNLNDLKGVIFTSLSIIINTIFYLVVNILLINYIYKNKKLLLFSIIFSSFTFILTIYYLFNVSTSIPGYQTGKTLTIEEFNSLKPIKKINDIVFELKYCITCKLIKDIRTFHCNYCKICILKHDHHCGFVSNCIGLKNYLIFIKFIIICFIHCLYICCTSILIMIKIKDYSKDKKNELKFNIINIFIALVLVFSGFFSLFLLSLIIQHIESISKNETTREAIKKKYNNKVFDKGCKENWKEICCNKNKLTMKLIEENIQNNENIIKLNKIIM